MGSLESGHREPQEMNAGDQMKLRGTIFPLQHIYSSGQRAFLPLGKAKDGLFSGSLSKLGVIPPNEAWPIAPRPSFLNFQSWCFLLIGIVSKAWAFY